MVLNLATPLMTVLILIVASAMSTSLIAFRWWYSGAPGYLFLVWNLFLAWLPLFAALAAALCRRSILLLAVMAGVWMLFLPNAPYIVTDLIHLGRWSHPGAPPLWYDLLMLLAFSLTGLWLGFFSLDVMRSVVSRRWGRTGDWLFAVTALGLSSLGVYVGRFLRWNSWDLLLEPAAVLADLQAILLDPLANRGAWVFSALFTVMLLLIYPGGRFDERSEGVSYLMLLGGRARNGVMKRIRRLTTSGRERGATSATP